MTAVAFLRKILAAATFAAAALGVAAPAAAQTVNPPFAAGTGPFAVAVNPVTNRIYVASEFSNSVTVIDGATNAVTSIPVGTRPEFIAVNPVTNKVYVNNALDSTLTEIDGATNAPTTFPIGSWGPISINPVTNKVYIVRFTGPATDEVTVFDADTHTWYTMATLSFQPNAMALNPVTNMLYVSHYASGHIRAIDGASTSDHPPSTEIGVWAKPVAVTVNPVTNKVYVLTEDSRGPIAVIDGADNSAVFLTPAGHAVGPRAIAVNPVTNKIYAAFVDEVIVIDGATNALTFIPSGSASGSPVAIGINSRTNKVYVPNSDGSLTVIDGATDAATTLTIPAGAKGIGVNPVTNKMYVVADQVTVIDGAAGDTVQANPIATTITPLPGNSGSANPTITLQAASGFSPTAPQILRVYYQMDGTGPWLEAAGTGPYTASPTGLAPGSHTIRAFAVDAQVAPSIVTQQQSTPLIGNIASYTFTAGGAASPVLSFATADHEIAENGGSVTVQVTRSGSASGAVGVTWTTANGSAVAGSDFGASGSGTQASGTLSWPDGDSATKSFTVPILDDSAFEALETFAITLSAPTGGATLGTATTEVAIADDERGFRLAASTLTVNESGPNVTLVVERIGSTDAAASVSFATANGSAAAGSDYSAAAGVIDFAAGQASRTITIGPSAAAAPYVAIIDDAAIESPETFTIALSSPSGGAVLATPASATVTIASHDRTVAMAAATASVGEAGGSVALQVQRAGDPSGPVSVPFAFTSETATGGTHFTGTPGTLTWGDGDMAAKTINVPIANDTADNPDRTFRVTLGTPTNAQLGAPASTQVSIVDDDEPVVVEATISFGAATYQVNENGPNITVEVVRTGPLDAAASARVSTANGSALSGSDYYAASVALYFAAGQASRTITVGPAAAAYPAVRILDDTAMEGPETFQLAITAPSPGLAMGANATATVTILSNERSVALSAATLAVSESAGTASVQVVRTGTPTGAVTASYSFLNGTAINGPHYTGTSGTVTWADGDAEPKTISIPIIDNDAVNPARYFRVRLMGATGATLGTPNLATVTIQDDDNTVQFSAATATATEGSAALVLTVTRLGGTAAAASVGWTTADGTAIAGTDYGTSGMASPVAGTVSWAAGEGGTKSVSIPLLDDAAIEGAKTFTVSLSGATGATLGANATVNVTLNDNDRGVAFAQPAYEVSESGRSVTLSVQRSGSSAGAASVRWKTVNGTALAGEDFGISGSAVQRSGTLSWASGDGSAKSISIPIIADTASDGDKAFTVELEMPSAGMTIGTPGVATVTVEDDDLPPQSALSFSQPKYLALEGDAEVTLTVTRTALPGGGFDSGVSVGYVTAAGNAMAGSDFTTRSGSLSWAPGESGAKAIVIPIASDNVPEALEAFTVRLHNPGPTGAILTPTASVLVVDDDEGFPEAGAVPEGWTVPAGAAGGWHVSNDPGAIEGAYSLRSDLVGDGDSAQIETSGTFAAGTLAFRVRISSEAGFDALRFYVDGEQVGEWSGTAATSWLFFSMALPAGEHTLRWSYEKDGSASMGSDAAWIDAVVLPAMAP